MTRRSKQTPDDTPMVKIECNFIHQTEKAWIVEVMKPGEKKESREVLPKSQTAYHHKGLDEWVMVPEWLALDRGLI